MQSNFIAISEAIAGGAGGEGGAGAGGPRSRAFARRELRRDRRWIGGHGAAGARGRGLL
ncbi:hypothetical protein predicted by Glimmer/Critica [Sorangium cellulosum So ce56]|uniref:Uncharacterized protein n=1 Tax=Sorangium cellulosum (strain So ce56) TaxID=448385 RepID=A9F6C0_SORC5|nr:hypothetical protein predicted by Glimmer/Critica [Sorangium cellulosum So ce56]